LVTAILINRNRVDILLIRLVGIKFYCFSGNVNAYKSVLYGGCVNEGLVPLGVGFGDSKSLYQDGRGLNHISTFFNTQSSTAFTDSFHPCMK
jgi:hypothetical protein